MDNVFLLATVAGFLFGVWPLIFKLVDSNSSPALIVILVPIGTLIVGMWNLSSFKFQTGNILLGLSAGIMNGLGMLIYAKLLSMGSNSIDISKSVDMSKSIPLTAAAIPAFAAIGAIMIFNEPMTLKKGLGLAAAIIAALLLA